MGDYTHADLLAAIDKFQRGVEAEMYEHYQPTLLLAYLDTLRAILDLAALWDDQRADYPQRSSEGRYAAAAVGLCADGLRARVADALRKMGVL